MLLVGVHEHAQAIVHRDAPARRLFEWQRRRELGRAHARAHAINE